MDRKDATGAATDAAQVAGQAASRTVREVGGFIREQRKNAQLSLRHLARLADVSDPYLSQIERGLRKPSADVLQRLASALAIRAETLYYQAGLLSEPSDDLADRIRAEPSLSESQKRALVEIYESFRAGAERSPQPPEPTQLRQE